MKGKIYISGRITGLPYMEAVEKFSKMEAVLQTLGYEVLNPLKNGLNSAASWCEHIVVDIKMLLEADAVFMLDGWHHSTGARIEHYIANETGKHIYYGHIADYGTVD